MQRLREVLVHLKSTYCFIEHVACKQKKYACEDALQGLRIDRVGHLGADRSEEDARGGDAEERRKMDVADGVGPARKSSQMPAADDVADGAGKSNREAEGGGGADGVVHLDVAPGHEGHGDEAAARTDQGGDDADHGASTKHAGCAGQMARRCGLSAEEHLGCGRVDEDGEDECHPEGRQGAGDLRAQNGAQEDARRHRKDDVPEHGAALGMRTDRRERSEENRAH